MCNGPFIYGISLHLFTSIHNSDYIDDTWVFNTILNNRLVIFAL